MEEVYEGSAELYDVLKEEEVRLAIPIFEETVEWAGAINARIQGKPKIFYHSLLFRHKPKMKRRAHLGGLKVGVFEEADSKEDVHQFLRRINEVMLKEVGEELAPIHVKAFDKAGDVGHRKIQSYEAIEQLPDQAFPCLLESHLDGTEVSCEVFIHKGNIAFLNITEYVVFGYSMMVPPTEEMENKRDHIRQEVEKLIDAFDIQNGLIHPEFFVKDYDIYFIELAKRIPGGNIFELIQRTYGFDPYQAHILCSDPLTTKQEIDDFFPKEDQAQGYAGSLMVYPQVKNIKRLNLPRDLEEQPGFDRHDLFKPVHRKVADMEGFGTPHGTIYFYHENCDEVAKPLRDYVDHDYFI